MVGINRMANQIFRLDRRALLAGLGAAVLGPAAPPALAQARLAQASPTLASSRQGRYPHLAPGRAGYANMSLVGPDLRFKRGDSPEIAFGNDLPAPMVLNWRGIDGAASAEPLFARAAAAPGVQETFEIPLRSAGTFVCDLRLLATARRGHRGRCRSWSGKARPAVVDRDEVFLIEDWRLRADGTAIAPGTDAKDTRLVYTVNGRPTLGSYGPDQ